MSDGIDFIHPSSLTANKVAGISNSFNARPPLSDNASDANSLSENKEDNLFKTQRDQQIEQPHNVSENASPSNALEPESITEKGHEEAQHHLLLQLSMLAMPKPKVIDPENKEAFEIAFYPLIRDAELCAQLTDPNFDRSVSKVNFKSTDASLKEDHTSSITQQELFREHLNDPAVRTALKLLAKQPERGNIETLALKMAIKNMQVSNLDVTQITKDSQKNLEIQQKTNEESLTSYKKKLEQSRSEIQKAMKNPVARWFSAIFKGIAGVVASIFTADPAIALRAIGSAHDDVIKAQYDPSKGKDYGYILNKLGKSPFNSKWFKILTTIVAIGGMAATAVFALPKILTSVGTAVAKLGSKQITKFVGRSQGIKTLERSGGKITQIGEKLGEKQTKLLKPLMDKFSAATRTEGKAATKAEESANAQSATQAAATNNPAQQSQTAAATRNEKAVDEFSSEKSAAATSTDSPLVNFILHAKKLYGHFGNHQGKGGALAGAVRLTDAADDYVEEKADAGAKYYRTQASIDMDTQRARYARMNASFVDLANRVKQARASGMSQSLSSGSQIMKEISDEKIKMVSRHL